ncbi:conserved hypothetical protein [Mesorhizobium metallidurans STM 2683]|uniref:DUF1127 domain-containing protein n=1 Tax=Mesorhizobium metallidurans STM 2683 TaxID=1297569 RepID=M5EIL1_9HYPH|nr:hypothetical protein [Mesorhizobium metallidurans]CCV04504.1 conserved hypothetical protein [Mesorhizobium metallidurans STM 2683]
MSHIVLKSPAVGPTWLRAAIEWFRHAKIALKLPHEPSLPHEDVEDLSDRQLRDIGAEREDVTRAMDRELGRLGLLDIGWQKRRR